MRSSACTLSVANPNRDGTGTLVLLAAPAAPGARIDWVTLIAMGATTVGAIRFFLKTPDGAFHLFKEFAVSAVTGGWSGTYIPTASPPALPSLLRIEAGCEVHVSTEKAETFSVVAFGD